MTPAPITISLLRNKPNQPTPRQPHHLFLETTPRAPNRHNPMPCDTLSAGLPHEGSTASSTRRAVPRSFNACRSQNLTTRHFSMPVAPQSVQVPSQSPFSPRPTALLWGTMFLLDAGVLTRRFQSGALPVQDLFNRRTVHRGLSSGAIL